MINPFSIAMNKGLRTAKSLAAVTPDFKPATAKHPPKATFNRQQPHRIDNWLRNSRPTGQGLAV